MLNFSRLGKVGRLGNQLFLYGRRLLLHQTSGAPQDGSHGRIALCQEYFHLVGGYNEAFNPMGYQDVDLIQRLVKIGLFYIPKCNSKYNKAIVNTKNESMLYVNSTKNYLDMCVENMRLSINNICSDNIIANNGHGGVKKNIFQYTNGYLLRNPE